MKVNLDLTATAGTNLIDDEIQSNVGASAFNLEHDFFYGSTELEIWTAAGQTGTQLVEDTDYTLGGINENLTSRAGRNVYSTVTVTNATYQTGDLYFAYQAAADYVDATDRYRVERASGQYYDLTSTGTFEVATSDTGANSVVVNSAGGIDIDTLNGIVISDTYDSTGTGIGITLESANSSTGTGGDIVVQTTAASGTAGGIDLSTDSTVRISLASTGDTIFYGTASTTGALPVITLDQADVDEPFFKVIGDAASATITNNIVAAGDTGGGTSVAGYLKIEVQDDGNQVADGDYYIPFYTLA